MSVEFVFNTYLELAANANKFGHYKLASRWFKAVLDELQRAESDAPLRAAVLSKMACIYTENQQYRQAESTYRRALALWHALPSGQAQVKCGTLLNLAELCILQGKYGQSEQYFRRALSAQKSGTRPDNQQLRQILARLAYVLVKRNKLSAAHSILQELEALERQP
jgi:tetratricopeptide (TPR) repeat protein